MADEEINVQAVEFWKWFSQHQQVLVDEFNDVNVDLTDDESGVAQQTFSRVEKVLDEMMVHLHKYDERLFPYCGFSPEGEIELIVTAEGNVEAFESAHQLIDEAPDYAGWKIMALKPRAVGLADDFEIRTQDGEVGPGSIQYSIIKMEQETILLLVIESDEDELEEEDAYMGVNLVEALLGEQDLATGFDAVDMVTTARYSEMTQQWPLSDLSNLTREFDRRRLH